MIKYLGSKRTLIPSILRVVRAAAAPPATVLDLFSGTSRVGHALKRAGYRVIANDHNAYAHTLAACYVAADAEDVAGEAGMVLEMLNTVARGEAGGAEEHWFVRDYCRRARYFLPGNGGKIAAVRETIERLDTTADVRAVLLTSLLRAADRVDSTTGVQMAFLKEWAPRTKRTLEMRMPEVLARAVSGKGEAHGLEAVEAASRFEADVAYLDPPYNQHSYLGNYHVWETLVRWDRPAVFGRACKREDVRARRSRFNSRRSCRAAFAEVVAAVRAPVLVVSFSDEGFLAREEVIGILESRGEVACIAHDYQRYVGAKIGIYNPRGEKVGRVGRLRNTEYLFVAARDPDVIGRVLAAGAEGNAQRAERAGFAPVASGVSQE